MISENIYHVTGGEGDGGAGGGRGRNRGRSRKGGRGGELEPGAKGEERLEGGGKGEDKSNKRRQREK